MGLFPKVSKTPKIKSDKKARSYLQQLDDRMARIEQAVILPKPKKIKAMRKRVTEGNPEYYLGRKRGRYGY